MRHLFFFLLAIVLQAALYAQTIHYVKPIASGLADGSSWANASNDIQQMIDASADTDTIWIAAGTYQPNAGSSFTLVRGTSLIGGFNGTETSTTARNLQANVTILKAAADMRVLLRQTNQSSVFDGLDITGGRTNASGAGMAATGGGNLHMNNCKIYNNSHITNAGGGALSLSNGRFFLTNCLIYDNKGINFFAIYAYADYVYLTNCTIINNRGYLSTYGTAIQNSSNHFYIRNSIFWGNDRGIASQYAAPVITYSCIQGGDNTNGNINIDPLFVSGSYTLQPGSPCLNTGDPQTNATSYETQAGSGDLAGNHRIAETIIDMGAYETNSSALPVHFGTVSAAIKNNQLHIDWVTESEINNDHFDIEISADGKQFTTIGMVASRAIAGGSNTALTYQYSTDISQLMSVWGAAAFALLLLFPAGMKRHTTGLAALLLIAGVLFWSCSKQDQPSGNSNNLFLRIVQVDKDGKKAYSKILRVSEQ